MTLRSSIHWSGCMIYVRLQGMWPTSLVSESVDTQGPGQSGVCCKGSCVHSDTERRNTTLCCVLLVSLHLFLVTLCSVVSHRLHMCLQSGFSFHCTVVLDVRNRKLCQQCCQATSVKQTTAAECLQASTSALFQAKLD